MRTIEGLLAEIIAKHVRGPFSWEQEPGVFVKVGPEGLAKRLVMKLEAAKKEHGVKP